MNWTSGEALFRSIWQTVEDHIGYEPKDKRLQILIELLRGFQNAGAQITDLRGISEEVDQALGFINVPSPTESGSFDWEHTPLDTTSIDRPSTYSFANGPFDGSSFCLAVDVQELPPRAITFKCDPTSSRGAGDVTYELKEVVQHDADGDLVDHLVIYTSADSQ